MIDWKSRAGAAELALQAAQTRDTYRRIREASGKPADYGVDLADWVLHMRNRRDELGAELGREMDETNRLEEEIEKLKAERNHEHRIVQAIINEFCQFCRDNVPLDPTVQLTAKGRLWTHYNGKTNCGASRLRRVIEDKAALRSAPPSGPQVIIGVDVAFGSDATVLSCPNCHAILQAPFDKTDAWEERKDLARQVPAAPGGFTGPREIRDDAGVTYPADKSVEYSGPQDSPSRSEWISVEEFFQTGDWFPFHAGVRQNLGEFEKRICIAFAKACIALPAPPSPAREKEKAE